MRLSPRQVEILRLALSQLYMTTDTGQERADIAEIMAVLPAAGENTAPEPG